jgi:hypothetical protein
MTTHPKAQIFNAMPNTMFLEGLPDFDKCPRCGFAHQPPVQNSLCSYNYSASKMEAIAKDKEILAQLLPLLENLTWQENMAVGQTAYFLLSTLSSQDTLLKLVQVKTTPLSTPLREAMKILEGLSPGGLTQVATTILAEDIEIKAGGGEDNCDCCCEEEYPDCDEEHPGYADEYGHTFGGGPDTEEHPSYI